MDYHELLRKHHHREQLTSDDIADAIESLLDDIDRTIETLEHTKEIPIMGAFDDVKNVTIPSPDGTKASESFRKIHPNATAEEEFRAKWKWDAHEQIIIRGQFITADQEAMENASSTIDGKGKKRKIEMRTGSARRTLLERMIVDWTLTKGGKPVPVTPENIGKLPTNYRKPILEACDEIAMTLDEDEQDDFLPTANEPTKAS